MLKGETAPHVNLTAGFCFLSVLAGAFAGQRDVHLDKNFFLTHAQKARSETFINLREVSTRFRLPPGEYLVVPSTFEPNKDGDFCLRVFSEKQTETQPCDDPVDAKLENETVSDSEVDASFRGLFAKLAGSRPCPTQATRLTGGPLCGRAQLMAESGSSEKPARYSAGVKDDQISVSTSFSRPYSFSAFSVVRRVMHIRGPSNDSSPSLLQDMLISAVELKTILNKIIAKRTDIKTDGFSLETCRVLVNLMDDSGDGKLGLGEFATLWKKIQKYLGIYKKNDLDSSGKISTPELRMALKEAGFCLNDVIFQLLVARYADTDLTIDFDDFVACLMRLEMMFRMFKKIDPHNTGSIEVDLNQLWDWLVALSAKDFRRRPRPAGAEGVGSNDRGSACASSTGDDEALKPGVGVGERPAVRGHLLPRPADVYWGFKEPRPTLLQKKNPRRNGGKRPHESSRQPVKKKCFIVLDHQEC
ncbi:hypothetical protein NFI96_026724 [Prochilodus magdalenae]|nr:hypothetical protein NFI96_026724 [Prochilodus magdalenae]